MPLRPSDPTRSPTSARDLLRAARACWPTRLPDAFGNALVNAWMAEQGIAGRADHPPRPARLRGGPRHGRLEFRPPAARTRCDPPTAVQLADLVLAARRTVRGEFAPTRRAHAALAQLIQVGSERRRREGQGGRGLQPDDLAGRSAYGP